MSSLLVSEDEVEGFSFPFERRREDQTSFVKAWNLEELHPFFLFVSFLPRFQGGGNGQELAPLTKRERVFFMSTQSNRCSLLSWEVRKASLLSCSGSGPVRGCLPLAKGKGALFFLVKLEGVFLLVSMVRKRTLALLLKSGGALPLLLGGGLFNLLNHD